MSHGLLNTNSVYERTIRAPLVIVLTVEVGPDGAFEDLHAVVDDDMPIDDQDRVDMAGHVLSQMMRTVNFTGGRLRDALDIIPDYPENDVVLAMVAVLADLQDSLSAPVGRLH